MSWSVVIGLEIHVQLNTRSKLFSSAPNQFGCEPNGNAHLIDLGYPGTLPFLNEAAVQFAIRLGLALHGRINPRSIFARKNYFYPDLPKGYQISQFEQPIIEGGSLELKRNDGSQFMLPLTRAHLEEDAGKSVHDRFPGETGIDLNRAGTPLLEIVSEPALRSAEDAALAMREIHRLVTWLNICDGNMAEGSLRCDANVSIRRTPTDPFGTRVEIKNLNSFAFVELAIKVEMARQIDVLESGGTLVQETRLFDPDKRETRSMRGKEQAHDYRYFPDPDLPPVLISAAQIERERVALPELPARAHARLCGLGLSADEAEQLTRERALTEYFDAIQGAPKTVANWVLGELKPRLSDEHLGADQSPLSPSTLSALIARIDDGTLSSKIARELFRDLYAGEPSVDALIERKGLRQINDEGALRAIVADVLKAHPEQVAAIRAGNDRLKQFLLGMAMKQSRGQANPGKLSAILSAELKP